MRFHPCVRSADWKTRDAKGSVYTDGNTAAMRAYKIKYSYGSLLRAMLAANISLRGSDHKDTLTARVILGEVLAAAACISLTSPTEAIVLGWGKVPQSDADAVLEEALASVRRCGLPLTSDLAVRAVTAYACCLCQRGLFAESANMLREVLEAFVLQDGTYNSASWGGDAGLGYQIEALARHTRKAGPEACLAGATLLRTHLAALHTFTDVQHGYSMRDLYYDKDTLLLLSHCRNAEGGALLAEAEKLARQLVVAELHKWDLKPFVKLPKVLEAQAALGTEGAESAAAECRTLMI